MVIHARNFVTSDDALGGSVIEKSLRINSLDNPKLYHTTSSTSNTFTISIWMKPSDFKKSYRHIFSSYADSFSFNNDYRIRFIDEGSGSAYSTGFFREQNAWYHFVMAVNSSGTTVYANGETIITSSFTFSLNNGSDKIRFIWFPGDVAEFTWDGYIADAYLIDGQAKAPTDFGYTESQTGLWRPKRYTGTYGSGGFHLEFKDSSAIGKDTSGNGNDFTTENLAASDIVLDTPTNNFCIFNELSNYDNSTLSEGNVKVVGTGSDHNWQQVRGNMGVSSGKWYFEVRCNSISATEGWIAGIHEIFARDTDGYWWYNGSYTAAAFGYAYGVQDNNQRRTNGSSDSTFSSDVTAGKVVGVRMDLDNNEILISVDGVDKGKMYDIQSGITYAPAVNIYTSSSATLNCGQDSTFGGEESAGGNTDSNGIGDFAYAVPSGYLALCSNNLPPNVPSIIRPQKHFDTITYTGTDTSAARTVTGLEFAPDLVWQKRRNGTNWHTWHDTVRGANKSLYPNSNTAEATNNQYGYISAFGSNGFTWSPGSTNNSDGNETSGTFVSWCWKAGGAAVSNSDGTITASVSANQEAGFSIISYTGNSTSGATIGHGLGRTPKWFIVKSRSQNRGWNNYHVSIGNTKYIQLQQDHTPETQSGWWNNTSPTSSVITLGNDGDVNDSSQNYVCYAWSEIPGYSKFGKYVGNGSSNGTYVGLGFRPAWLMIKNISTDERDWDITTAKISTSNPITNYINANTNSAEGSYTYCDFLSNGFKLRNTGNTLNTNGDTYIYMAFAEQPGTTSFDTFPNAR